MSIHPSLRGVDTLRGQRSVYSRIERIQALMKDGKMTDGESPYGLPKVRTQFKAKAKKKKKEAETTTAEGEGAEAEASKE